MKKMLQNREILLAVLILAMILLVGMITPDFLLPSNLLAVYNDTSILIILALGQMLVILTRCIDLSVAANLALTGMVVAMLNSAYPALPVPLLMAAGALLGLLLGIVNGALVWKLGIPAIVVTLGTMSIYRGLVFLLSDGAWVNAHEMSASFVSIPRATVLGLPVLAWVSVLVIVIMVHFTRQRRLGREIYAAGNNPTAAFYTGIQVGRLQFVAFSISGLLAGLCGYLWVSRYAVAYVDVAAGFELQVIAACVIGGVSIMGGIGTVQGCVLGALFLGVINNALPVLGVSPFWQMAISGAVIVIAVIANSRAERKVGRIILKKAALHAG
ncbi:branched-chain amino acid ABC transporter permease [Marinobacterium aestuarii]|uniref:Autoinducer 2 import system permease protein LsrC n=1 Tax=Marinobacterium aestuarii TaxID=1821621 RepID=A0A1A9EZS7_9GAMM|nr:ABC transporter permease [Marinobacterium aestuarii]ANG63574.1 branched-chain amino acid ABC transporter permease [Marinobacterium aestuarii]